MKEIKFSHDYEKLPRNWEGTQAILLAVEPSNVEEVKRRFPQLIEYDTKLRGKNEHYKLNFDEGILLIFCHINTGIIFMTIRKHTTDKYAYYHHAKAETFVMVKS